MRKAADNTLVHLITATDAQRAVTIRYIKENGEVSRRRIEVHSFRVTKAGNITIYAWDHRDEEMTTFRVDRITHYTLHRSARLATYVHPVVANVIHALDQDTDEIVGFRAWDNMYKLTA